QGVTERFYILPSVVVAFCGGLGLAALLEPIERKSRWIGIGAFGLVLLTIGLRVPSTAAVVSQKDDTFTRDLGANLLEGLPPYVILLTEGDFFHNSFYYQQASLKKRPDIEFIDQQKLTYPWYVGQVRRRGRFRLPAGMTAYSADTLTQAGAWLDLNLTKDR